MSFDQKAILFVASTAEDIRAGGQKYTKSLPSPCMSVCQMDEASGLCGGCLRTLDEIAAWGNATEATQRAIWHRIGTRAAAVQEALAEDLFDAAPTNPS